MFPWSETERKKMGEYLKEKRKGAGLSQSAVASSLKLSNGQFISNIERGVCATPLRVLEKLIRLYKIPGNEALNFFMDLQNTAARRHLRAIVTKGSPQNDERQVG